MKILFLYRGAYPHGMAMTKRLHLYAKGLQEQGIEVEVATATHDGGDRREVKTYEGIPYYPLWFPFAGSKNPVLRRLAILLSNYNIALHFLRRGRGVDVIWPISFPWPTLLLLGLFRRLFGVKMVLEQNEYPNITTGTGRFQLDSPLIQRFKQWMHFNPVYRLTDGFVVISTALEQIVVRKKRKNARLIKVPILTRPLANQVGGDARERRFSDPFMFHAGTLNEQKDGILAVFRAFARVVREKRGNLRFVLTNKMTIPKVMNQIREIIRENGIEDRVHFHDHLTNEEVDRLMSECALAVINRPENIQNIHNFSTKLGEYLQHGIPVISTPVGEAGNFLKDEENAYLVPPNDVEAMAEKIHTIVSHPEAAIELAERGRQMAEAKFDYRIHAPRLATFFQQLTGERVSESAPATQKETSTVPLSND